MSRKPHAVICGAGKMGVAIGYAMKKLGYDLSIVENREQSVKGFFERNGECTTRPNLSQLKGEFDVVVSALPYHANVDAATWAIDNGVRYCDLGGSVPTSRQIKDLAEKNAKKPVMTDLGLAPGWINLVAEELWQKEHGLHTIEMMVGGIPENKHEADPLDYMLTWSFDGLINEYIDDCESLENGEVIKLEGLSGCNPVVVDGEHLEAFCTSGASAHSIPIMKERGVRNCVYKTLRYPGHCRMIKFLTTALRNDKKALLRILQEGTAYHKKDKVVMSVIGRTNLGTLEKTQTIHATDEFSAMQRATAFPISAVADLMARGMFDEHRYANYHHVPLSEFNENLNKLFG